LNSTNKTAILVFARSAQQDAEQKGLVNGDLLFHALTNATLNKVKRTKLPYFHITEMEQQGDSFGARFVNAIESIYAQGFDAVITIGNDSPQLQSKHLLCAYEQLQLGHTVLGPSLDGGFYLMGLHKSKFDSQLFLRLPWQRFGLFQRILQAVQTDKDAVFELPVLAEIDSLRDLIRLGNFVKTIPLYLRSFLHYFIPQSFWLPAKKLGNVIDGYALNLKNKGSPLFFSIQ